MDEDFLDVTESGNKKILFILIFIIVLIMVFGYFFVFKKFNFTLKTMSVEVNSTLSEDVKDYLKGNIVDASGYKLDISRVKPNEVGEYTYTVTYNKIEKKGKIKVVDTKAPVFEVQDLSVEEGDENFYIGNFLTKCEDDSKPCIVTFKDPKDEEKLNKEGSYKVTIVVSDIHKNSKEAVVNLNVVKKGTLVDLRTSDLEYASASIELKDFIDQYYKKLEKAIDPESEENRDESSYLSVIDLEEYVSNNYPGYKLKESQIVELYNKSNFVIGYAILITIDNGSEKTVYVTK